MGWNILIEQYYHIASTDYSVIGWLLVPAIFLLSLSAFLHGHYHVFHTTSFQVSTFAKTTSVAIGFISIIMIILATDWWWGFAGVAGYQILFFLSLAFWRNRYANSTPAEKIQKRRAKKPVCPHCGLEMNKTRKV